MFFKQFPKVDYDFKRDGVIQKMVDIYRSVRPLENFLDEYTGYKFYNVKNGERPDIVSGRLYGTSRYYWTFFLVNEHLHDGYRSWPLSQEALQAYMDKQYDGFVIETAPKVSSNFENSLAGRFQLGETITGLTSGATGTLTKKNIDLSQLVVQNVTGTFIGEGTQGAKESVQGSISTDSVSTHKVYKYIDAPYYYYETDVDTRIDRINITAPGSGYSSAPTIEIIGNGSGAQAVATVSNGAIISIIVTSKGSGYTSSPTIKITGGGGTGGSAKAVILPNEKKPVTNALHINGGQYTSNTNYVSNREHIEEKNDSYSRIKYVDPANINNFTRAFKELLNR